MRHDHYQLHSVAERDHWWFRARRQVLLRIIGHAVSQQTGTSLIDVGCSTGANVAELAKRYSIVGIDPSATAIAFARERFPGVSFLHGQAPEDLNGLMETADLFLLADVLEHVRDDFKLLSRLLAGAKPGACFLITVPAGSSLWSRHDESHGHYRRYDRERLERLWQGLPVTPLLVSYFNTRLYPIIKAVRTINRWRGRAFGEADTDLKMPSRAVNRLLERVFAGEQKRLLNLLCGKTKHAYRRGVSLIALLRREEGQIVARTKPDDVAPDCFDPAVRAAAEGPSRFSQQGIIETVPARQSPPAQGAVP